jgi:hypothetical protein
VKAKEEKNIEKKIREAIKRKDLRYINQEKNFIRETFKKYFRPSYHIPKERRNLYTYTLGTRNNYRRIL